MIHAFHVSCSDVTLIASVLHETHRRGFRDMRSPLIAVLCSHGLVSRGLAFAPPSAAAVLLQRAGRKSFLFSPEHGDLDGPVVTTASTTAKKRAASAGNDEARKPGGGWGSWEEVVSQREEQESVLRKLEASSGLRIRTVNKGDMLSISRLCIDTFRGPFQWFELPLQLFQEFAFYGQIQGRLGRVTRNEIKHSMVIAEDTSSSKVVGFLEIGMLPKPSSSEESTLAREALATERAAAAVAAAATAAEEAAAAAAAAAAIGGKRKGSQKVDRPSSSPTEATFGAGAAADVDGVDATMGREESRDGEDESRGAGETAIKRERQPDVAYLANVVVDRRQRRRGIGRTMVSSAIEIVRELWPAEDNIYVSVEQASKKKAKGRGNDIALALYQGMGFEMAAVEDEMLARSRRRPPRIYLSKPLD
ncbi:unnamed protein product [Pylaiella littoralis]